MNEKRLKVVGGLLTVALLLTVFTGCTPPPKKLDKVGLQLWSVRGQMQDDFKGTLIKVAEAGYDQVEFAGYYGWEPADLRALLDSLGLTAPAAHVGYDLLSGENLAKTIADAKVLGMNTLIMPSLPRLRPPAEGENRRERRPYTVEDVKEIAEVFNEIGQACKDAGLGFAFHNHSHEFVMVDSTEILYDILLQETDPALVSFEMDLGWTVAAGADPLAYFDKYPGRFSYFHIKDMDADNHSVVVGQGVIDWAPILAASEKAGAKYFIVEYEGREDPIGSVAASVEYLKALEF